jgi:hypothetical protein
MPAEPEMPAPRPSADGSGPPPSRDRPPRGEAVETAAESASARSEATSSPIAAWSQRHATAASAARVGMASSSRPDPSPIVSWSRRHAEAARAARAARTAPGESGPSTASGARDSESARPDQSGSGPRSALAAVASVAAVLGWLVGLLMVLHLIFIAFHANPANSWMIVVESWAPRLDLGLPTLIVLPNPAIGGWIGYGIAAIIWVLVGTVLSRVIRRIAARRSSTTA